MLALGVSSKVNAEWAFLTHLARPGQKSRQDWLSRHYDDLGVRSTLDLSWVFSESVQPAHLRKAPSGTTRSARPVDDGLGSDRYTRLTLQACILDPVLLARRDRPKRASKPWGFRHPARARPAGLAGVSGLEHFVAGAGCGADRRRFRRRTDCLPYWTQTFMDNASRFIAQFFPMFLLGALFGKLMEDSGSVAAIADFMIREAGAAAERY